MNPDDNDQIKEDGWDIKACMNELKFFPASTFKDQVDCLSDAYNYLIKLVRRGRVVKYCSEYNMVGWSKFRAKFGAVIPENFKVHVGLRLGADMSKPSGYAIVARAPENARIGEAIFVVSGRRMFVSSIEPVLDAVKVDLIRYCANGVSQGGHVWLRNDGADVITVASEKHGMHLANFLDDELAGLPELNWYFEPIREASPFYMMPDGKTPRVGSSRAFLLVDDAQVPSPVDDGGLLALRQELDNWAYNEHGRPQDFGGTIPDCVRLVVRDFSLDATLLTPYEREQSRLRPELRDEKILEKLGTPEFVTAYYAQMHEKKVLREREEANTREQMRSSKFIKPTPTQRGRFRKKPK